jgi:hypothetical protein
VELRRGFDAVIRIAFETARGPRTSAGRLLPPVHFGSARLIKETVRRWLQLVALVLISAVFASARCSAYCANAPGDSSAAGPVNHCHHSSGNEQSKSACPYQHSQFFSPEAGLDLGGFARAHALRILPAPVLPGRITPISIRELSLTRDATAPARVRAVGCVSVLRI